MIGNNLQGTVAPQLVRNNPDFGTTVDQLVGNTPLIKFPRITAHLSDGVAVYAKAEWTNPAGSVKDRPALNIIREAIRRGELRQGITLLDSTSGNMGIAYATYAQALGFKVELVVPANASTERITILKSLGVKLTLSDPAYGSDGAIRKVRETYENNPEKYFYANQYNNDDNWRAHYKSTGVEIWNQTHGQITHFVAGLGTSGTLRGTGTRLKEYNPNIQLIAMQPDSPFHGLEGLKHMDTAIKPGIYDENLADENVVVLTEDAYDMCRRLAREEGVLVGISSGAALVSAILKAESLEYGVIIALFPDDASKYLSDPFWQE